MYEHKERLLVARVHTCTCMHGHVQLYSHAYTYASELIQA